MRRTRSGGRLTFTWCLMCALPASAALGQEQKPDSAAAPAAVKLPPEQLEALVAPIALYPDPLLAQTLVASTYPLEVIQLNQWLAKHPGLKDKALADSVAKQPWDPAIQSMAAVPEVVKRLSDDIQWATELGNAFLAQQGEVMDAVQRLRKKAKDKGALESNEQQKVETKVVEKETVIIVEQANPEIVYVPTYVPTVVYGPPPYPYPPIYYPPYPPPGAAFVSFSFGVMMGAAIWGGSCCYAGWGHGNNNTIIINNNNNFNQINNINRGGAGNNNWNHNASHRGGAPYGDRATASKYGGSAAGASNRAGGGASASNRAAGGATANNRASAGATPSNRAPSASASNRASAAGAGNRASSAGSDRVGSRDIPKSSGSKPNAMGGGSRGYSGSSARASSSRGSSSMGSRGGSRGGGGRRR